jgi:CheY-like chemotaxis protein
MPRLLVVRPGPVQVDVLGQALRSHISEDVVVAGSIDDALSSIDRDIPDVVLLPTLTPAAVEDYIVSYLRTNPDAGHVQILVIPWLELADRSVQRRAHSLFSWRWRQGRTADTLGCDPGMFIQDVVKYLAGAKALKEEIDLYSADAALTRKPERRSDPRFRNSEVPWISFVRLGSEQGALVNVSSRGALLRTQNRPEQHFLRRSDSNLREERPHLTLELGSRREVHVIGRVIRCVPLRTSAGMQYEIAFSFDHSVGLYLPAADALTSAPSGTNND